MRLNDALIANEKYRGEPTTDDEGRQLWPVCILWDDDLQGFGVRIFPSQRGRPSRKDFIVTWKVGLRTRTMAIGTFGADCTLRQARRTAREALDLARRGQDPIEVRQRALGIGTAEDLASRFLYEHSAARKKPAARGGDSVANPDAGGVGTPEPVEPDPGPAEALAPEAPASGEEAETAAVMDEAAAPAPEIGLPSEPASPAPAEEEAPSLTTEPVVPALEALPEALPEEPEVAPAAPAAPAPPPPVAAPAPASASLPRRPATPPPTALKRGPTKVRLLPVPESLYRVIEHGARESNMTIAVYLNALIEIARAAVGDSGGAGAADGGPSVSELFSQVQEAQAVEAGGADKGGGEQG